MAKITKIGATAPELHRRKRTAAYARVSKETERTMHSLSAQISYYNDLIQKKPEWEFAGVYSDEAVTGTSTEKRQGFQNMIDDCEAGRIDIVLTKSISRFARNTVDLLETVRHLKDLGVEVRFEKEHINTLTADGELMLTILASYAQEEVETMSQNIKWTIRNHFKIGQLSGCCSFLGYKWDDSQKKLVVVPEEAETVRKIFRMYRDGYSLQKIVDSLHAEGIRSCRGRRFQKTTISNILTNITYTGNLLLQKTFSQDPISKRFRWNKGELPQYYAEDTHEAIIDKSTFEAVQKRLEMIHKEGNALCYETRPFSRKLVCSECGSHYTRGVTKKNSGNRYYYWKCWKRKEHGMRGCKGRQVSEIKLMAYSCDVLGWDTFDGEKFREMVEKIIVREDGLAFVLYDGMRREIADVKRNHYSGKEKDKRK